MEQNENNSFNVDQSTTVMNNGNTNNGVDSSSTNIAQQQATNLNQSGLGSGSWPNAGSGFNPHQHGMGVASGAPQMFTNGMPQYQPFHPYMMNNQGMMQNGQNNGNNIIYHPYGHHNMGGLTNNGPNMQSGQNLGTNAMHNVNVNNNNIENEGKHHPGMDGTMMQNGQANGNNMMHQYQVNPGFSGVNNNGFTMQNGHGYGSNMMHSNNQTDNSGGNNNNEQANQYKTDPAQYGHFNGGNIMFGFGNNQMGNPSMPFGFPMPLTNMNMDPTGNQLRNFEMMQNGQNNGSNMEQHQQNSSSRTQSSNVSTQIVKDKLGISSDSGKEKEVSSFTASTVTPLKPPPSDSLISNDSNNEDRDTPKIS